jgi:hypothetical protein
MSAGPSSDWISFKLWPAQRDVAQLFQDNRLLVCLKARQLGLTWLSLAFGLWHLLLHPVATVLLFSRRDDEATDLLQRMKWMYARLPPWLKAQAVAIDNDHEWQLADGSRAMAFPTTAGDSYTATLAIVDEADLVPDLDALLRAVKPTIDAAGRLLLVSRADKTSPESAFKRIYRAAKSGDSEWKPVFLPWDSRPDRDQAWYEAQKKDIKDRTGAEDDLHEQYPATDAEALAPRSLDKRLPPEWLNRCYKPAEPVAVGQGGPALPALTVYVPPRAGRAYVVGADPAEGNPTSDESAATILDRETGEEVAVLAGKFEPATFAGYISTAAYWYNHAPILVERNNHGHAAILWLRDNAPNLMLLCGHDQKTGWLSNSKGKSVMYDAAGITFRDGDAVIHGLDTFSQLASIEGSTLRAPDGQHDDKAVSFVLALQGRARLKRYGTPTVSYGPILCTQGKTDPCSYGTPIAATCLPDFFDELPTYVDARDHEYYRRCIDGPPPQTWTDEQHQRVMNEIRKGQ